jgi:hypothetical protein
VSSEADPALGVPYGNDLQFPGVFGKWYLYVVLEGHFRSDIIVCGFKILLQLMLR